MNNMNPQSQGFKLNTMGKLFEDIGKIYLEFPGGLNAYLGPKNVHHSLKLSKGTTEEVPGSWQDFLNECSKLPPSSQGNTPRRILVPYCMNQPVVDMMDACDRAYQFTVGKEHGLNLSKFVSIVETMKLSQQKPLNLYFVILEDNLSQFSFQYEGKKDLSKLNKARKSVGKKVYTEMDLKLCLRVYWICIPKHPGRNIEELIEKLQKE